ncbi:MAG TPA: hypothetical protein VF522_04835 [Ramlibacter sp.]|uniref:hypothetical protein n=1 Tax=Ramlibacter sp. TaxID=1917967 RepID=UPI002ED374E6
MSREDERHLGTADLARAGEAPEPMQAQDLRPGDGGMHAEPLAALFQGQAAEEFRRRWDAIQIGFVDDPRAAVQNADELVAQVLRSLAESFSQQRSEIESGIGSGDQANTENMRIALQRYRSFFQRLLSL